MFHSFFNSLARSRYLSLFSHSFSFILWSARTAKSTIFQTGVSWWSFTGVWVTANLSNNVIWMVLILPLISRTLLSILADLSNAVIWMVLILPLISRTLLSILADLSNAVIWMVLILPLISRTLLSILADLSNAVVWMVLILPLISNSSSIFSKTLGDHSKHSNSNWYYLLFHRFF